MVLETHMKLCVTELDFSEKDFCPQNWENRPKMDQKKGFWIYWKISTLSFTEFVLQWKFILFAVFLNISHIWENFSFGYMDQNVLSQSTISPEQINEFAGYFALWYKFM